MSFKVETRDGDEVEIRSPVFGFYVSGDKKMFVLSDDPPDVIYSNTFKAYIANPSDHDWKDNLFLIGFGHFGTRFLVWAKGAEDALEEAAQAALDAGMKGFFIDDDQMKELYDEAREELGPNATDEDVMEQAEADLTYTESGYITSYEWTLDDVNPGDGFGQGEDLYGATKYVCEAYTDEEEPTYELKPNAVGQRHYVGVAGGKREVFSSQREPTSESHPQYRAVIGPFKTKRAAAFMAERGAGNPHVQSVADAERISRGHRPNARGAALDEHAATELELFIENDYELVGKANSKGKMIEQNLLKKIKQGKFSHSLSIKLWEYLIEDGARKYAKEFSSADQWARIFSPATRRFVAERFAQSFSKEHGVLQKNGRATSPKGGSRFILEYLPYRSDRHPGHQGSVQEDMPSEAAAFRRARELCDRGELETATLVMPHLGTRALIADHGLMVLLGIYEHRGFRIEQSKGTQIGYRTGEGMRSKPGKGREVTSFCIFAPEDPERVIKNADTLKAARAYIDEYVS